MEKIINIDGRPVKFKSTGATLLKYKAQFQRDAIKDILAMMQAVNSVEKSGQQSLILQCAAIDLDTFYNIVWTLAKAGNDDIPGPIEWLDTFSEFPLMEILPEVMDLLLSCLQSSKKN